MIIKMFAVYDTKAEAYMQPFFMQTKGQALRAFQTTVNDSNSQMNKYPEDFVLFEIGEFDEKTATITDITNTSLGTAIEYIKEN